MLKRDREIIRGEHDRELMLTRKVDEGGDRWRLALRPRQNQEECASRSLAGFVNPGERRVSGLRPVEEAVYRERRPLILERLRKIGRKQILAQLIHLAPARVNSGSWNAAD